ncbi:hypothetical protein ARMSODRAFT_1018909 [Armillaria solidipes]|uniref:Uncharacterized protein n=1 Tax=Armillaria solidipes TaxID=1076256 RepID=A0A2H3BF62_9AGAR|nr:hypothetical protein ARMSODRAFT_1018909 [Armillaria solidipes]
MQADTVSDALWYRALFPCELDSSHHEKVQRHCHQVKRFHQLADSLDVTIADTNSHLFLLLALQDSEYQLLFGNAIWYEPGLVDHLSAYPFSEYSCPRCVEELASGCTIPYFYGNHRLTLPNGRSDTSKAQPLLLKLYDKDRAVGAETTP